MMFDFLRIAGPEDSKQENFSTLCTCLVMRLYPEAKPVEGRGGDEGIDTYVGEFDGQLHAFQHKYFRDGLKPTQKRQITSSLAQILSLHEATEWTLMLPWDLTPSEQRWFKTLQDAHPDIKLDWWGKTKLLDLLSQNRDLAATFQPAQPLTLVVLGKVGSRTELTLDHLNDRLEELGCVPLAGLTPSIHEKLTQDTLGNGLRILVWGSGENAGELYEKRLQIRDSLNNLGHDANFSEDLLSPDGLMAGGLNVSIEECLQAMAVDYIICLMVSPGSIGEVHDFAKKRHLARKMMVCVDQQHEDGYSAKGALRIFEGFNGKLDWFRVPEDLTECHLATRVLCQVEKTFEAKTWEFLDGGGLT